MAVRARALRSSASWIRRRPLVAGVLVAGVLTAVLAVSIGALLAQGGSGPSRPSVLAPPARSTVAAAHPIVVPDPGAPRGGMSALFVGASYTWGLGANPRTDGYAYQVGRDMGWPIEIDAVSGSGFVNPGPHHEGTFGQRLAHLPVSFDPGMVIIQGGRNDATAPEAALRAGISLAVHTARQRFAHARVVLLGPIPADFPISDGVRRVEKTLREVAGQDGADFIDPIAQQWITPQDAHLYTGAVPGHPNDAGYTLIAHRLCAQLHALLGDSTGVV